MGWEGWMEGQLIRGLREWVGLVSWVRESKGSLFMGQREVEELIHVERKKERISNPNHSLSHRCQ